jgi:AraC family transcriptional regulator of adaptative response/methylated-DNA-[protein]-cysteine methyltransferase
MTPRAYAAARRVQAADKALAVEPTVTDAIYAAGYSSNSRFYAAAAQRLGMAPATRRKGAPGEVIRHVFGESSLGLVVVAATPKGVCAIAIGDDRQTLLDDLARRFPRASLAEGEDRERKHLAAVIGLIEEPGRTAELPLDVRGTVFQEQVWQALRRIPLGKTATYAELAAAVGRPAAVRAVAQACAANPTAVVVPCHRVVRSDGDLSGYRWGAQRKAALLKREGAR